eukprot:362004-Chlamydomonas_euryale.AAC.7
MGFWASPVGIANDIRMHTTSCYDHHCGIVWAIIIGAVVHHLFGGCVTVGSVPVWWLCNCGCITCLVVVSLWMTPPLVRTDACCKGCALAVLLGTCPLPG